MLGRDITIPYTLTGNTLIIHDDICYSYWIDYTTNTEDYEFM